MSEKIIISGQNLFDFCLDVYGNIEAMSDLMKDNSVLTSWTFDISTIAGQSLVYDETKFNTIPSSTQATKTIKSTIKQVKGENNQSIFDMLMLTYLSFDNFIRLLSDSEQNFEKLSADGAVFTFDTRLTQNTSLLNYMTNFAPTKVASLYETDAFRVLNTGGYRLLSNGGRRKLRR